MEAADSPSFSKGIFNDLFEILILATAGLGLGLAINQLRDNPLPLVYESKELRIEKAVAELSRSAASQKPVEQITLPASATLEQVQQFIKEKRGFVFDARPEIFHRLGHIPGALSLPREDFENAYKVFQSRLERDYAQPIIVYCSGVSCEDADLVQKSLRALGYSNVAVFAGGWPEWEEKGLPVEAEQ